MLQELAPEGLIGGAAKVDGAGGADNVSIGIEPVAETSRDWRGVATVEIR